MIDGLAFSSPRYHENAAKTREGCSPCVVCGKPVDVTTRPAKSVRVHNGGHSIVTEDEADALNAAGEEASDMYYFPVGPDCLRRHPELRAYVVAKMRD